MEFNDSKTQSNPYENDFYNFLLEDHRDDLLEILKKSNPTQHYPLEILFIELGMNISEKILQSAESVLPLLDRAAFRALTEVYNSLEDKSNIVFKQHIHVRFLSMLADSSRTVFPGSKDVGQFMGLVGTIVRISEPKLLEYKRFYRCNKCKQIMIVEAVASRWYAFPKVDRCDNLCLNANIELFEPGENVKNNLSNYMRVKDYQEVKLQEQITSRTGFGNIPKALWVILEDDLVDSCKPGDDVVITGTLFLRWRAFRRDQPIITEVTFKANHVEVKNDQRASVQIGPEILSRFDKFWAGYEDNPFEGRNAILRSICPHIYGMYLVKLAVCVVLAGGVVKETGGATVRGQSHLLLVGDPGTGKSQILKYVSRITPRSVFTTGAGTTNAGLTVAAVRDNGEWHLEAGALVLADSGVCSIDEFSHIREHDRTSIHEAMEQQSISVAKAGMVCKLNTKCTVIAATNPKLNKYDPEESLELNVGLASPLLSRFDLIIALKDAQNDSWDEFLSDFILKHIDMFAYHADQAKKSGIIWDSDTVQSYLVLVKDKNPEMTEDAALVLSRYFQCQRNSATRKASRTTVRLLESLYRLAEGHARIMYRDYVSVHDAVTAVSLVEASMQSSALGQTPNSLHIAFPKDPLKEYCGQAETILQTLNLPEIWEREKIYLDHMTQRNSRLSMPPPPAPPSSRQTSQQPVTATQTRSDPACSESEHLDDRNTMEDGDIIPPKHDSSDYQSQQSCYDSPILFPEENTDDIELVTTTTNSPNPAAFTSTQNSNSNVGAAKSHIRPRFNHNLHDEFDEDILTPIRVIEDDDYFESNQKAFSTVLRTPSQNTKESGKKINKIMSQDGSGRFKRKRDEGEDETEVIRNSRIPQMPALSVNLNGGCSKSVSHKSVSNLIQRFRRVPRSQD